MAEVQCAKCGHFYLVQQKSDVCPSCQSPRRVTPEDTTGAKAYRIRRYFEREGKETLTIRDRVTLSEAQAHCRNPETSSKTATSAKAQRYTRLHGPWFDGYEERR